MAVTVYDGVIFVEGDFPAARVIDEVDIVMRFQWGMQEKNLNDVKKTLANKVKNMQGNCLINFKYGQRSATFANDSIAFYGSGKITVLSDQTYNLLLSKLNT